jgi:adenylate cyclase class IV
MADKNKEIEIHFILTKEHYQYFLSSLPYITAVQRRKNQKETYFFAPYKHVLHETSVSDWRKKGGKQGDRVILNFEHWYHAKVLSQGRTYCDAFDIKGKDSPALYKMFHALQGRKRCIVHKERSMFLAQNTSKIAFNQVNNVRYCREIETKKVSPKVHKGREQPIRLCQNSRIDTGTRETKGKGYLWLLLPKKQLLPSSSPS